MKMEVMNLKNLIINEQRLYKLINNILKKIMKYHRLVVFKSSTFVVWIMESRDLQSSDRSTSIQKTSLLVFSL